MKNFGKIGRFRAQLLGDPCRGWTALGKTDLSFLLGVLLSVVMVGCVMQPMPALYDRPEIEYLDGRAHPKVSPKTPHSIMQFAIARLIYGSAVGRGRTGAEWRFRPGAVDRRPTRFVPDVAFVERERLIRRECLTQHRAA
jgi:hypothetical protein